MARPSTPYYVLYWTTTRLLNPPFTLSADKTEIMAPAGLYSIQAMVRNRLSSAATANLYVNGSVVVLKATNPGTNAYGTQLLSGVLSFASPVSLSLVVINSQAFVDSTAEETSLVIQAL